MADDVIVDFGDHWKPPVPEGTREAVLAAGHNYDFAAENNIDIDLAQTPNPQTVASDLSGPPRWQKGSGINPYAEKKTGATPGDTTTDVTEESLQTNGVWIEASRIMMEANGEANARTVSDVEAAEYGKEFMGWFNYNIPVMAYRSSQLAHASNKQKLAMLYLMEKYEQKNVSWEGIQRMFWGMLRDPTTYFGLTTLGVGLWAGASAKQLTKVGFKSSLRKSLPAATAGSVEGGLYAGFDEYYRQNVKVEAGRQKEKDLGAIGTSAVMGTTLGAVIPPVAALTARAVKNIATAVSQSVPKVIGSGKTDIHSPEIIQARKDANDIAETYLIKSTKRNQLRGDIAHRLVADTPADQGQQMYIVLGPPASGKSTIAEPLALSTRSRIVDSDIAKRELPEFQNGIGGPAVHEESDLIMGSVLQRSTTNGDNMVIPLIGRDSKKIEKMIDKAKRWGYESHIIFVDLPIEEAASRAAYRFMNPEEDGVKRWVDPNYVLSIGEGWFKYPKDSPSRTYEALKNKVKSYAKYSNDVPRGSEPKVIEQGEN